MIGTENLGKSSQMSTVSSIQFVSPELSHSPGATVVQQEWMDVCIVEPHIKGKVHFGCSPHALHLSHRKLCKIDPSLDVHCRCDP